MATLNDVAALAGVSISAVSRVLSSDPSARVSVATRTRIEDAARELRYRPNFAARALKRSQTDVIALVVPDLTNAIFSELMSGVDEAARERGYTVLLSRAESIRPMAETIAHLVGEGRVDGVLVQLGDQMTTRELLPIIESHVPAILINSRRGGPIGSVTLADEEGARVAVEHLASLGHTEIGLVNGIASSETAQRRGRGFRDTMKRLGLTVRPEFITNLGYRPAQGRMALGELLTSERRPTAVVVANLNAAFGLLNEARLCGITVPGDLSVVAIHDAWTAENSWPPLTTVRMPLDELGRVALGAIVERIANDRIESVVVKDPPPTLIARESTSAAT